MTGSNAVRLKVFRSEITQHQANTVLATIEQDILTGAVLLVDCEWKPVLAEAEKLSSRLTSQLGQRAMDVLHVAAASVLGADKFLTFDSKQGVLGKAVGLSVHPLARLYPIWKQERVGKQ